VHARSIGLQAYVYGEPLLNTQRMFQTNTSVTVPVTGPRSSVHLL
jgi:hypothetical protein